MIRSRDDSWVQSVLFVAVSSELGGAELYALRLAAALRDRVTVKAAGLPDSPFLAEAEQLDLETVAVPIGAKLGKRTAVSNFLRFPVARRHLERVLRDQAEGGWTVLQYKWEELLWGGDYAARRVALLEHGPIPAPLLRVPGAKRRLRRAFQRAAVVFAASEPAVESIHALAGREPLLLPAGVDHVRAQHAVRSRESTRADWGIEPRDHLVAYAGRLTRAKGVAGVVTALAELPNAHALIIGDGPARKDLDELASRLELNGRIHFLGRVENPYPYLAAADATVLLSRHEGRPLVALESAAVGTPVVGLRSSPAMQALRRERADGVHLVDDESPRSVSAGMRSAISAGRVTPVAPGWDEAAGRLLDGLRTAEIG